MENSTNTANEKARRWMRDYMYQRIADIPEWRTLSDHLYLVFSHHGLTVRDIGKNFLNSRDWSEPTKRDEYLKDIKQFIETNIK